MRSQRGQWDKAWELCQRAADRRHARPGRRGSSGEAGARVEERIAGLQRRLQARRSTWARLRHGARDWDPLWVPDAAADKCQARPPPPLPRGSDCCNGAGPL